MKKLLFLVTAAVAGASVFAEQADHWTYNGSTITDGEWTFAATVKAGTTEMTVNAHSGNPSVASELDFSKPVTDNDGVTFTIVTLNPQFNNDAAGKLISKLTLPTEGLKTISNNAFNQCSALTEIVNYIPDSVVKVGTSSFYKCPVKQTLYVRGVTHFGSGGDHFSNNAFNSSGITRIVFGPGLKEINDWGNGPFSFCTSLTNVTFDAAMTGAKFSGGRNGGFYGCTALAGTIDLSGFSDLTYVGTVGGSGRALGKTAICKVILGEGLEKLDVGFFDQMESLVEVVFNSTPADFSFTTNIVGHCMFGGVSATQGVIARIHEADVDAWKHLAKDGIIDADDSTFSEEFAGKYYHMRYLLTDGTPSGGGELGYWVYDDETGVITNALGWAFKARVVVHSIKINGCVAYPATASLLDFSARMTDTRGVELLLDRLNPQLGSASNGAATDAGKKVAELRLPDIGRLLTIDAGAFASLLSCTNVVNFIPDSVTSIGAWAFFKLAANVKTSLDLPLRLYGITELGTNANKKKGIFESSGITSVTFGPGLKTIASWADGSFANCQSLTNVVFDPATSGAAFYGIRCDGFYNCKNLKGTLDLSGFSDCSYQHDNTGGLFDNTQIDTVIFGEGLTKLSSKFLNSMPKLTTVIFKGAPPPTFTTPYLGGISSAQGVTTWIYKKDKNAWTPYVLYKGQPVDKVPPGKGVTWKPEYVTAGIDLSLRPVRIIDLEPGLKLFVR